MVRTTIVRWNAISALVLVNAGLLASLAAVISARAAVGAAMGRGPSPSEVVGPFIALVTASGTVGLIALVGTVLFWMLGLAWIPTLRSHARTETTIRLSLVLVPLAFSLAFLLSRVSP